MTWLGRAIGAVAAGALRRARRRQALGHLTRAYEGARVGRRTEGWVAFGASANAEIGPALAQLRERSRVLVRNNPFATKAVQALLSNLVGTGIVPRVRSSRQRLVKAADHLRRAFAETADADGLSDLYGLQALVARTLAESGEVLVRLRDRRLEDGLPMPLQLQLLEPDHLDTRKTAELPDGRFVLQRVECDPLGRRRACWLFPVHPGEMASFARGRLLSQRVPAERVLHLFERLRPGQVRSVPWFAPAIARLRDLDEYDDAVRRAGDGLKATWRAQIVGAKLGPRPARTIRGQVYPKAGASLDAAVVVWSKAPVIVGAHDTGPLIRSGNGLWLSIPTPATDRSLRGGRITPREW